MDFHDYIRVIRRRWRLIALIAVLGTLGGILIATLTPREYTAHTQLFVSAQGGSRESDLLQSTPFTEARVKSYASIATSPAVLRPVADQFRIPGGSRSLAQQVSATAPLDTLLLNLSVTAATPRRAAELANAIGDNFERVAATLDPRSPDGGSPVRITMVARAEPPSVPSAPKRKLTVVLASVVGLALGLIISALRERLDTRVRSHADVEELTDSPVLGLIADSRREDGARLLVGAASKSIEAEAYRQLRTNLRFLNYGGTSRCVVVSSSVPQEGKTTTAVNLAVSLTETGERVALIEADLRRPALAHELGLTQAHGLTSVLVGRATLDDALVEYEDTGLWVLRAGPVPPNPSELLGSQAMEAVLANLCDRFDFILIDTPPLLPVTDAVVLAQKVDGVLFVVCAGVARRDLVKRSLAQLEGVGARVLGLVVNRLPTQGADAPGYYAASYDYSDSTRPSAPLSAASDRGA